ncbi:hypothetical protein E1K68_10320 [Pseudomonas sp. B2021]|nr:hypothetical protein [Pseudomonas sp. B2021]TKK01707.1 hypothetical protein PflCFBP13510_22330 [Pseudomonas fluorescens]
MGDWGSATRWYGSVSTWNGIKCGSWLACDGGVSVDTNIECQTAIAGKPAPTLTAPRSERPITSFLR